MSLTVVFNKTHHILFIPDSELRLLLDTPQHHHVMEIFFIPDTIPLQSYAEDPGRIFILNRTREYKGFKSESKSLILKHTLEGSNQPRRG